MKKLLLVFNVLMMTLLSFGQNQIIILNSSTHNTSGQYCGYWFYDDGDIGANYSNNQDYWITLQGNVPPNTHVRLSFASFDIASDDTLYIYDGPTIASPLLGKYNNSYNPLTGGNTMVQASLSNASGNLTVRLTTNGANTGAGWNATILCQQVCQEIIPQIDTNLMSPPIHYEDGFAYVDICHNGSITFAAAADASVFPQNDILYHQDAANCTFHWDFGDGTTANGQVVTHTYSSVNGYNVFLSITDSHGCVSTQQFYIRVRMAADHIVTVNPPSTLCTGDTLLLTSGSDPSSIVVTNSNNTTIHTEMYDSTTFIPDGPSCPQQCYGTPITFTSFPAGSHIQASSDIESICINMEHSFAGDLSFRIICPNGQSVVLDSYDNSGGSYLGVPVDDVGQGCTTSGNPAGTGWTYCWSELYPQQGLLNDLDAGTSPIPATDTINHSGYITPENPLSGLIGCPLNGTWSIEICDNWAIDNGYVFYWFLTLQNQSQTAGWTYNVPVDYVEWQGYGYQNMNDTTGLMVADSIGTFPYQVIVHDVFGCTYEGTFNVSVDGVTPPILGPDISICAGQSATLTAQGGLFYTWSTTQSGATITVTPAHTTTYSVTVTAANGCSLTDDIIVNVITPPNSVAGPDASVCSHNYTMQAVASVGNGTWTYTGPGTATFTDATSVVTSVSVSTDGQYTFVWSENNNGCVSSDTTLITFTTMPTPNAGSDITECQLSSTLHATPSFGTGTWTQISGPGTITFINNVNDPNTPITASTQGAYSLQWTEDNGNGCVQHDLVNVTLWQMPAANAGMLDSTCSLSYQMTATTSVGVGTWSQVSGPGATQFSDNHSPAASATASVHGSYNYAWTENNNGCISSDTVNIIFNYIPTSTFTISAINCFNDTATINFTGLVDSQVAYNWNFGNANVVSGSQGGPYLINYSNTGTFPVTLTVSQHGCVSNLTTVQVTNPPLLQLSLQKQDITCFGAMNGKVYTTVTGGTPPYNYLWSNGVPYSFITNAIAGNYSITVMDSKGCKQNDTTSIYEPPKLFIDIPDSIPICNDSSVTITASITGGIFPYTLLWSTGQTQQTITVSPHIPTSYFVTVYDANQCQTSDNLLVYIYPPLQLSYTTSNDSICPGEEFNIYPVASHGNGGPYQFYLDMQPVTLPIHLYPNISQEYQLQVKDGCNYVVTENVPIFVYPNPPINPSSNIINGCEPLTVVFNDGSPDAGQTYIWSFGDGESAYIKNPTHTFNNDGVYTITLTVTNIFGCKVDNVYPNWITVYPQPTARFEPNPLHATIIKPIFDFINYSTLTNSVMWYFGDGDSTSIYQPIHIYQAAPETYQVILVVYTNKGCVDTTWGTVIVDNVFTFYAPTAFSPNADGYNDEFRVFGNGIEDGSFTIQIFDRWGEVIWESNDINKGWDGKVKGGKVAQIGSYNWLARFRDENHVLHEESGSVTVIR